MPTIQYFTAFLVCKMGCARRSSMKLNVFDRKNLEKELTLEIRKTTSRTGAIGVGENYFPPNRCRSRSNDKMPGKLQAKVAP